MKISAILVVQDLEHIDDRVNYRLAAHIAGCVRKDGGAGVLFKLEEQPIEPRAVIVRHVSHRLLDLC